MTSESESVSRHTRLTEFRRCLTQCWSFAKQTVDFQALFTAAVVCGVTLFVVWNVSPWLWFTDTTPTGGDLGAHVWSPAYLRDELLPRLRLSGWSPDWYAGFPAFTFYMVVPSLLIVIINVGLGISIDVFSALGVALGAFVVGGRCRIELKSRLLLAFGFSAVSALWGAAVDGRVIATDMLGWSPFEPFTFNDTAIDLAIAVLLLPAAVAAGVWSMAASVVRWRGAITAAALIVTLLIVPVPYGVAIKLVVIAGVVTLPAAAYFAGRLSGLAHPTPALLSLSTLPFIFDRSFNIYGGNLMSTMAGEFAYSLALTLAVLFIGFAARGLQTGRDRAVAAVLLAFTGLLHLFAAFFALVAVLALLLLRIRWREIRWVAVVGTLAALLSAFWVLPFAWNVRYLNDMGWGKERRYAAALWHRGDGLGDQSFLVNDLPLQFFVVLAAIGALVCLVRRVRLGIALSIVAVVFAVAFVVLPESRLWNVRILPFYYLSIYLLAGIALAQISRLVAVVLARKPKDPCGGSSSSSQLRWTALPAGLFVLLILTLLAFPLRSVPFATSFQRVGADGKTSEVYGFANFFGLESVGGWNLFATGQTNLGPGWVRYNFTGYEQKAGTVEYNELIATMAKVGQEFGCGRALWEYNRERLGPYGTTMAPMLLPHWTDGCVGSMEGLYFEASATTPYHFLLQSELSESPSRSQRDLPYSNLNVQQGLAGLQTLGVRYYLAVSESAISQARATDGLIEISSSGPWVVFLVNDQEIAVGINQLPVVIDGLSAGGERWLVPAAATWLVTEDIPLLAAEGADDWPRLALEDISTQETDSAVASSASSPHGDRVAEIRALAAALPDWLVSTPVEPAKVVNVVVGNDSISFNVDRIGAPVLVRASYFPNWQVSGAEGPFRVSPNLMVVVPTESSVSLSYGRSAVEWIGWSATLIGLVLLVLVVCRNRDWSDLAGPALASAPDETSTTDDLRLSVVIPAYREKQRIASTIAEIRSSLASLEAGADLEIVVVDDGSGDGTANAAREAGADLVIELPQNQGKGAAVRAGVLASRGRTVAFTDADLAYSPDQLLLMLNAVEAGCDLAIGSRLSELSVAQGEVSSLRRLGSRAVNLLARALLSLPYRDTQCGCKAFRADVAKVLMSAGKIDGFAFDIELLHLGERHGLVIVEVPVTVVNSATSTVQTLNDGFRVVRDILRIRRLDERGDYLLQFTDQTRCESASLAYGDESGVDSTHDR